MKPKLVQNKIINFDSYNKKINFNYFIIIFLFIISIILYNRYKNKKTKYE